jgi:hypothetical protein
LSESITIPLAEYQALRAVADTATCIRHWSDTFYNRKTERCEGMSVSADKVRELWSRLADLDAVRKGEAVTPTGLMPEIDPQTADAFYILCLETTNLEGDFRWRYLRGDTQCSTPFFARAQRLARSEVEAKHMGYEFGFLAIPCEVVAWLSDTSGGDDDRVVTLTPENLRVLLNQAWQRPRERK